MPEFDPYPISLQESLLCALAEDDVYNRAGQPSNKALEACIQEASSRIEKAPGFDKLVPAERQGLRARYLEELRNKINQHPFVDLKEAAKIGFRNPVYREYYLAGRVAQDSSTDWGILARASDASHYLALFFLHHIEDRDLARYQGFLFHFISLLATSSSGDNFLFKLEWSPSHTRWEGTVECPDLQVDQFFFGDQVLIVELPLQATLQNVVLSGGKECMVELSGPGPEHAFSDPVVLRDCVIQAGEVSLNAAALRFDGLTVTTRLLQLDDKVARLEGLDSLLVQGLTDEDPLLECSEYARGQWGDGIVSKVQTNEQGKALFQSKLAKMLRWFRRHGRPEYACYDKKFQTCALNGKQDQNAVLLAEFLIDKGLLNRRESLIVMDQDAFASYGVSYKKQNEIDFGEKFESLYDCLVRSQYGASYA